MIKFIRFLMLTFGLLAAGVYAKDDPRADYIRSHYAKFEYQIPMRDGTKLFTAVYLPNDISQKYPILMMRTPYSVGPYGEDKYRKKLGPSESFEKDGYIFVFQDVRGKFMSEGEFVNMRPQDAYRRGKKAVDDATDTYDTIEWLLKNIPNNNGRVGQWGISYPGYYTGVSAINSHPALKAISPQAPIADWYFDDFHRNGVFVPPMAFWFFDRFDQQRQGQFAYWPEGMKQPTPDGYDFFLKLGSLANVNKRYFKGERPFWNEIIAHPDYDDYWQARNVLPHYNKVKPQVLVVGGWYDTEDLYGPLATYQTMSKHNKKENVRLVMGPWSHGQWNRGDGSKLGEADFGFNTSAYFQEHIQKPFFDHYLKPGRKKALNLARVTLFETGANRWRQFSRWPLTDLPTKTLYLHTDGQLSEAKPQENSASLSYISDPAKPVPHTMAITRGWDKPYMVEDQRFAARRPDVLVFETKPLRHGVTVAGEIRVKLWVKTDQGDADFVVKLVDVFPAMDENNNEMDKAKGNRHELVRWNVMRGRYRNSFTEPEPMPANEWVELEFLLLDVLHRFKRGHKLQIQIQSTMFPFLERNPQKYVANIFSAKDEDYVMARHSLAMDANRSSFIHVSVLK